MSNSRQRQRAIATMLDATGDALFAHCAWCNCRLVWAQKLPPEDIENMTPDGYPVRIVYRMNGRRRTDLRVTVDHIVELSRGGCNHAHNLTLSCQPCNSARSNPHEGRYPSCVQCGGDNTGKARKRCSKCVAENSKKRHELAGLVAKRTAKLKL